MRNWNLKSGDPLSLILAADIRTSPIDYYNDQIWELSIGKGPVPSIALQTTFGLRAKSLRIYPSFKFSGETRSDPNTFSEPVVIRRIYPNLISLIYSPFPDLDVITEYWVPRSQCITGRVIITNESPSTMKVGVSWVTQLSPTQGERMAPLELQAVTVLAGTTDGLAPLFFMSGGPKHSTSPHPSLTHTIDLKSGKQWEQTWSLASLNEPEDSFQLARRTIAKNWAAERSYIEMLNEGGIEIITGDPDWDVAFMLAQKQAITYFVGPTENLPHPSIVFSREMDDGFSLRGDGSDYAHAWNGQSPFESYFLSNIILPVAPTLVKGLFLNFMAAQKEEGEIDWKPGLAGQRSKLIATPMLCSLAWRIYEATLDITFLDDVFPDLLRFVLSWFTPDHDRDGDGIPEWDHPLQAALEDHPVYSSWHSWSQGVDITTTEGPGLCALLFRECQVLIQIAEVLGIDDPIENIRSLADRLKSAVDSSWDEVESCYFDWDRDTHMTNTRQLFAELEGSGLMEFNEGVEQPLRLLFHLKTSDEATRRNHIFIHGTSLSGKNRVEHISDENIRWHLDRGVCTSQFAFSSVDKIEIKELSPGDRVEVYRVGLKHHELPSLLPLWAGIPDEEQAHHLVNESILNHHKFWQKFGLPNCIDLHEAEQADICSNVSIPWNVLIGEGLLKYGYREEVAFLVDRLMTGIIGNLKQDGAFRRGHHSKTGSGYGERNPLVGLAPISLFLEALGVRLISPHKVVLSEFNPFPWPVTVKYRGMTILRQRDKSTVIFPDGQSHIVDDPAPQLISLEFDQDDSKE